MDIKSIKSSLQKMLKSFEKEGKPFKFAAMVPAYVGAKNTSYTIYLAADWFTDKSFGEHIRPVYERIFELIEPDIRFYINRIDVFDPEDNYPYLTEDLILINKIGYKILPWKVMPASFYAD